MLSGVAKLTTIMVVTCKCFEDARDTIDNVSLAVGPKTNNTKTIPDSKPAISRRHLHDLFFCSVLCSSCNIVQTALTFHYKLKSCTYSILTHSLRLTAWKYHEPCPMLVFKGTLTFGLDILMGSESFLLSVSEQSGNCPLSNFMAPFILALSAILFSCYLAWFIIFTFFAISEKVLTIQQFNDVATILIRKHGESSSVKNVQ